VVSDMWLKRLYTIWVRMCLSSFALIGPVTMLLALPVSNTSAQSKLDEMAQAGAVRMLWKADSSPCVLTKPMVSKNVLFVGSCDRKFYALEKKSGRVVWSYDTRVDGDSGIFQAIPLLHKDLVIAGTVGQCGAADAGYVFAFDQRTGKVRWRLKASVASVAFADIDDAAPNSSIVFGTREGEWLSIEASSGSVNWRFNTTPPGPNCESRISVVTDGASVCLLSYDRNVHCLQAKSGHELWKQSPPSPLTTDVFMYKDVLYFGAANSHIYGLDPENGRTLVRLKTAYTLHGNIAESDKDTKGDFEFAYATGKNSGNDAVVSFADEFGSVLWSRTSTELWTTGAPEPWKGRLFAGNCKGDILAYSTPDGKPWWSGHINGCISSFTHDDSSLYISTREGVVYQYQPPISVHLTPRALP